MLMIKLTITEDEASQRLDRFLRKAFKSVSISLIYKLIRSGKVVVNGKGATIDQKLEISDEVTILEDVKIEKTPSRSSFVDPDMALKLAADFRKLVSYQDHDIIVIDKPAGIASHAGSAHETNNLTAMLLSYLKWDQSQVCAFKPALINRLDKETSGLILAAKSGIALRKLNSASRDRKIEKVYLAMVCGVPTLKSGQLLDLLNLNDSKYKYSMLEYRVRQSYNKLLGGKVFSLLEVKLITGRTHQIRVQFASRSHPLVGDKIYGDVRINLLFHSSFGLKRHFLHSHLLSFQHPKNDQFMEFQSDLPADLKRILGMGY